MDRIVVQTTAAHPNIGGFTAINFALIKNLSEDTSITATWTDTESNACEKVIGPGGVLLTQSVDPSVTPSLSTASGEAEAVLCIWGSV